MHSDVAILKLKSNESQSAKKMQFSGLLFIDPEAGASAVAIVGLYLSYEDGKKRLAVYYILR